MSEFESFKAAIFGQESGNGKVDTSSPNYAGALGKGQILESTFNGLKANGKIPATAKWTNPADNELAAGAYMQEAWQATGGKPELAAAYYYGGPKAVKDGQVVTFKDLKNPKAPSTNEYSASILKRMGMEPSAGPTPPASAGRVVLGDMQAQARAYDMMIAAGVQGSIIRPASRQAFDARLESDQWEQEIIREGAPTGFERFGAAVAGNTQSRIVNGVVERLFSPEFPPVPGYKSDLALLPPGADSDVIEAYGTATSPEQAAQALDKYSAEQARLKAVMNGGMYTGLALGLAAEGVAIPNWVAPMAAARTLALYGKGSLALAAAGRPAASVGAAVTENILSGSALEAIAQSAEGKFKPQDMLVSLAADSLMGVGFGLAGLSHAKTLIQRSVEERVLRDASLAARAQATLGPNAQPTDISKAMDELLGKDVNDLMHSSLAGVPVERRIVDEPLNSLETPSKFADPANEARVGREMTSDSRFKEMADLGVFKHTDDFAERKLQLEQLDATPGVHLADNIKDNLVYGRYAKALEDLRVQLVPEVSIHFTDGGKGLGTSTGVQGIVKPGVSMIAIKPGGGMRAAVHEFSHVVFAHRLAKATPEQKTALVKEWKDWQDDLFSAPGKAQEAMLRRSPVAATSDANGTAVTNEALQGDWKRSLNDVFGLVFNDRAELAKFQGYFSNFNEYSAEQLVKQIEAISLGEVKSNLKVPTSLLAMFKTLIQSALDVFRVAKEKKLIAPSVEFRKFFDDLVDGNKQAGLGPVNPSSELQAMDTPSAPAPADVVAEFMTDPATVKFGLNLAPVSTPVERAQAQAMLALHKRAEAWAVKNPKDAAWDARASNLADNSVFNVASAGLLMLKSESPLVRMLASELVEDASGVAGKRNATAAISKYMTERLIMGNVINDIQGAYGFWKVGRPGGLQDDLIGGHNWAEFNKEIASEIEARRFGKSSVTSDPNVKAAADSIEATYARSANAQRDVGTLGADGLPASSVGYMPHKMSPKAVMNLTNEQGQILHQALTDQFLGLPGWDPTTADKVATNYMKRVRDRASGDYSSNIGGQSQGTSELVKEALQGMGLPDDIIAKHMDGFTKGGAGFTKGRIELDLNKVHKTEQGEFRLLDIFETNQVELLRSQAGRASGEIALTKFGVQGKPGLKLLRDAMQYGEDGAKANVRDKEAFDQIASEFMNEPFGTKTGKFMERAMAANTLVRLGGMAFNQIAESINGIYHLGALRTFDSLTGVPRLTREISALVKGEKVDNPFLTSIEQAGGAEFGTDSYKMVMPFDSPDHAYPTYGQDTLTLTDRLLRGGGHLQAKLSGWRLIHSAQQRGMAEQIVHKMMRYVREGKDDIALDQFGINADIRKALSADLDKVAVFNGDQLVSFDVTKITDPAIREQVIQAVWRGTQQIIQGTFIGERGKWAHDGWLKLMTQFRSFGLVSMEKQWGRQRNSHGDFQALGMLIGSMSIAAPIFMARTYAASIGRPDQEEYLERQLTAQNIARATLNYVAMSGMAGDAIDFSTSLLPESLGVKPAGGRPGTETDFIGNYILPASSLVDDIWKYAQSPTKAEDAVKILPFSRLPYMIPLLNEAKD